MSPPRFVARVADRLRSLAGWEALRDGVSICRLWGTPSSGPTVALLRYAPGARVPAHRHAGAEIIYVLEGSQRDERGRYDAGMLVVNREGEVHSVFSEDGCVVLIVWERPVEFVEPSGT